MLVPRSEEAPDRRDATNKTRSFNPESSIRRGDSVINKSRDRTAVRRRESAILATMERRIIKE
jgi:hypothetical protein